LAANDVAPRHLVLGTAGHIDHGKTALVRALTGIDTDTLAEEKQRGITINLGFAYLDLWERDSAESQSHHLERASTDPPHADRAGQDAALKSRAPQEQAGRASSVPTGIRLGIVDVPGHARFIRNMVAGASGIDLVMLVVAADDGVMPQTVEHLQICRLLGVRRGLVALTKADLVEPELLELADEDVRSLLAGTFLAGCPVIPVSSATGAGLDELRAALYQLASAAPPRDAGGRFRLAVDRSFSVKGAGTVATGTALAGSVAVGEELELLPTGRRLRVRGIQVHGADAASAAAGQRTALNLAGVDWQDVHRGDMLAAPGTLAATARLDCELTLLPGGYAPLRSGSAAELHLGTSELPVKLKLLEAARLAPGATGLVQLGLAHPLACAAGDRFILRSSDGGRTIGGGVVLDPQPPRHVRRRAAAAEQLAALDVDDPAARLLHEAAKKPYGLTAETAAGLLGWEAEAVEAALPAARERGLAAQGSGRQAYLTAPANRERIVRFAAERLEGYHAAHPLSRRGLSAAELAAGLSSRAGAVSPEAVAGALDAAVQAGALLKQFGTYCLPGRVVQLTAKDQQTLKLVIARTRWTLTPPQPDELLPEVPVDKKRLAQLVAMLLEDGELAAAPGPVYFDPAIVQTVRERVTLHLAAAGPKAGLTVSDFNALVGTSRKYGIPLLQLLENEGTLRRDGDLRKLK
jgi:selenocysteine-specific elongation factor